MRISDAFPVAAATPWDSGSFRRRTAASFGFVYYTDASGSIDQKIIDVGVGERDVTIDQVVTARGPAYLDVGALIGVSGTRAAAVAGNKLETIQELGGMSQLEITAAQQAIPNDAPGAVSYRIWLDVEAA